MKNIYDLLSSKGKNKDKYIRNVLGTPSHVDRTEKDAIDLYGDKVQWVQTDLTKEWDVKKADGLHALSIMATVMKDMFEQYTKGSAKVKLDKNSPDTKAAIMLKDGQIHMAYDQKVDPMVTKGLIVACLWKLIENSRTEYHPLDDITNTLTFDIKE